MTPSKGYRPSFTIDSSIALITNLGLLVTVFITSIVISRTLGPADKGIYSFALLIPTAGAQLLNLGLSSANIYFLGRNRLASGPLVGNALLFSMCAGGVSALLLLLLSPWIRTHFLSGVTEFHIYLAIPLIPGLILHDMVTNFLLADRKMLQVGSVQIVQPIVYLLCLIFFYYADQISVLTALISYVAGFFISFLMGLFFLITGRYLTSFAVNLVLLRQTLQFGIKQHLGTIFQILNYRVDMLFIAAMLTDADLGFYSVSVMVAETVWRLPGTIGTVLYAKIAADPDKDNAQFASLICRTTVLITLLIVVLLFFASEILIPLLYSTAFYPSVRALQLLLPGVLFLAVAKILNSLIVGTGKPELPTIAAGVSLVVMVVFDLLLIPTMGINGAAIATSLCYLASGCMSLYFFQRVTGSRWYSCLLFRGRDVQTFVTTVRQLMRESGLVPSREHSPPHQPMDM